jgi:hypothetical protein
VKSLDLRRHSYYDIEKALKKKSKEEEGEKKVKVFSLPSALLQAHCYRTSQSNNYFEIHLSLAQQYETKNSKSKLSRISKEITFTSFKPKEISK